MPVLENTDKIQSQDETSKPQADVNVDPQGEPTTPAAAIEPSKEDSEKKIQAAVQNHVELRKKAEEEARIASEEKAKALAELQALQAEVTTERESRLKETIISKVERSNLPEGLKQRAIKDPVKWVLANVDNAPQKENIAEVAKFVSENLGGLVNQLEKELGVENSPRRFVDSDNSSLNTPSQTISVESVKKMSPYEIDRLMDKDPNLKKSLLNAGGKSEF